MHYFIILKIGSGQKEGFEPFFRAGYNRRIITEEQTAQIATEVIEYK